MTELDLSKLNALLACAHDIAAVQIPAVYQRHEVGEQVEDAVADMLTDAADYLDRAAKLLAETGQHEATVAYLGDLIRRTLTKIEGHRADAAAWREVPLWVAMAEGEQATKH